MTDPYGDALPETPDEPSEPSAAESASVDCWRCGKTFEAALAACPYCRAKATNPQVVVAPFAMSERRGVIADDPTSPVVKLIGFFAALLFTSIVFGMVYRNKFSGIDELTDADRHWLLWATLVMEAIDTVIVIAAWVTLQRPGVTFRSTSPVWAWALGLPVLAVLLCLNFGYHWVLVQIVPSLDEPERMLPNHEIFYLIGYGLQPAIVEELFFRGLALDWFRTAMTSRAALVVSSVMFGMCHVYAPVSVPYLIVAGIVLGAARMLSGGLALPMLLHFLHNFIVVLFEHHRV